MDSFNNLSKCFFIRSPAACYNTEFRGTRFFYLFCCLEYNGRVNHRMCRNGCLIVSRLGTECTIFWAGSSLGTYNTTEIYALVLVFCCDFVGEADEIKQVLFAKKS